MRKYIYLYVNNRDSEELLKYIHENHAFLYNSDGERIYTLPALYCDSFDFYIGEEYEKNIYYRPCFYTNKFLQSAVIILDNCEDDNDIKLFKKIKKFIQKNYRISTDRSVYIGQHMYRDWEEKKFMMPILFCLEFKFEYSKLEEFINSLVDVGYKVKNNYVRVGNKDILNYTADYFVVFSRDENMITSLHNRKLFSYENGSECIWMYKIKKGKSIQVQVVLDERIAKNKECEMYVLFEKLKNKWEVTS